MKSDKRAGDKDSQYLEQEEKQMIKSLAQLATPLPKPCSK